MLIYALPVGDENRGSSLTKPLPAPVPVPCGYSFLPASFIFRSAGAMLARPQMSVHALLNIGRSGETEAEEWQSEEKCLHTVQEGHFSRQVSKERHSWP